MKRLLLIPLLLFFVTGCSHITMLRTEEIQEINVQRKEAIAAGMSMKEAMEKYK